MKVWVHNNKTNEDVFIDAVDAREYTASKEWEYPTGTKAPLEDKTQATGVLGGVDPASTPAFDTSIEAPAPKQSKAPKRVRKAQVG